MKKLIKKAFAMLMIMLFVLGTVSTVFANPQNTSDAALPTPIAAEQEIKLPEDEIQVTKESGKMSTGGVILMFFLAVILNAGISFSISNRFYKMSKKDSHLQSEIRALRRDIDEKFSGNVKEIKESGSVVKNTNPSYAGKSQIVPKDEPVTDEIAEIAKKWNISIEREDEPDVKIRPARKLQTREDVKPKHKEKKPESQSPIKNRAKEILGDIFPFDDEE